MLALHCPFSHFWPPQDEDIPGSPGHRYQVRHFLTGVKRCRTLGIFTGVDLRDGKHQAGLGSQNLQDHMTRFVAKFELLLAFAANFTDMQCPHWDPDGLKGQCNLKESKSAGHSREEPSDQGEFCLHCFLTFYTSIFSSVKWDNSSPYYRFWLSRG